MTKELKQLSGMLFDINRSIADVVRVRDTLKNITWSLEARINELHNSPEYQEDLRRRLLEEKE